MDPAIGFAHALFEVAIDIRKRAENLDDSASLLAAMKTTDYNSVVGPLKRTGQPVKNVTKTPLVAGQWRMIDNIFNLVVCENKTAPEIPVQEKLNFLSRTIKVKVERRRVTKGAINLAGVMAMFFCFARGAEPLKIGMGLRSPEPLLNLVATKLRAQSSLLKK